MSGIPAHLRNLPQVDFFLHNGDELMSLLIDLSNTSDSELTEILKDEIAVSETFDTCVVYDGFEIKRQGNQVFVWPTLKGLKIKLFCGDSAPVQPPCVHRTKV